LTEVPDFIEPVIGWRVWRISHRRPEAGLMSAIIRTRWPRLQPLQATCEVFRPIWRRRRPHEVPEPDCTCGIHAAPLSTLEQQLAGTPLGRKPYLAIGRVALWGRVVECEQGWRAELAYPEKLFVIMPPDAEPETGSRVASGLASYGVDVTVAVAEPGGQGFGASLSRLAESV
jgi:hypothetical protein